MKINSASLAEASTLASQIEALQGQLDELNGKASEVSKQLVPLQSKFQNIVGALGGRTSRVSKCSRKGSRFTPEQRAKISEGLKAKWAARKAAAVAKAAADVAPVGVSVVA